MNITAIIVAAGRGTRAGDGTPKQWQPLGDRRVIDHTIRAFVSHPDVGHIVVVVNGDDMDHAAGLATDDVTVTTGGDTRTQSVRNGLKCAKGTTHVLIHDAARPCVSADVISGVIKALHTGAAAAPGLAVSDALWRGSDGLVSGTLDRDGLFAAQTPQGFALEAITTAHAAYDGIAADDVTVAQASGIAVAITQGCADNLKITTVDDFARAARILGVKMDIRCGNGFDVHAFGPGDHVMLFGVKIPHDQGLIGHSDADVGLHTLADAIYGALAMGDIGQHFPPSDPQWKGVSSDVFLRHAAELARTSGFALSNLDATLICELPQIGPHAAAMRGRVAEITGLDVDRISVKATTTERLGFAGRKEGIACMATATVVRS